jgi:hypothetical protein
MALQLAMSLGHGGEIEKVLITAELERFRSLPLSQGEASKVLEFESVANNVQNRIPLLTALLSLHPGDYVYPRLLADELWRESQTSDAAISYHMGIELDPMPRTHKRYGIVMSEPHLQYLLSEGNPSRGNDSTREIFKDSRGRLEPKSY